MIKYYIMRKFSFLMFLANFISVVSHLKGWRGRPPLLVWKLKNIRIFERKALILSIFELKFSIWNVVLRVSRKKKLQNISLRGLFFWCFWRNLYQSTLVLQTSPPWPENYWLGTCTAKRSILNVCQCSEYMSR